MLCLDTYALVEIWRGNPAFLRLFNENFVITDFALAEFYIFLYKQEKEKEADSWNETLSVYSRSISRSTLIKSLKYRYDNKKENLSIIDSVGYIYALENELKFVTGDKAFKGKDNVLFIQK